ncbi:hypothetical protein QJS04_geneDACA002361 [Acorus gramineus]|uniref:Uncharacterized protein n=1 Tax=Acorus gramineus TaxID=55184 RepID=A0AAV9A7R2_ACOGR|nr:hypothetical protein QJS04_geneDACA002361 [Acorus gramineus]
MAQDDVVGRDVGFYGGVSGRTVPVRLRTTGRGETSGDVALHHHHIGLVERRPVLHPVAEFPEAHLREVSKILPNKQIINYS